MGSEAVLDIAARQRMQHTERAQRDGPAIARARTLPRGVEDGHFVRLAAMTGEIDQSPRLSGILDLRRRDVTEQGRGKPEQQAPARRKTVKIERTKKSRGGKEG